MYLLSIGGTPEMELLECKVVINETSTSIETEKSGLEGEMESFSPRKHGQFMNAAYQSNVIIDKLSNVSFIH